MATPEKLTKMMQLEMDKSLNVKTFAVALIVWDDNDLPKIIGSCKEITKTLEKLKKRGKIKDWKIQSIHEEE